MYGLRLRVTINARVMVLHPLDAHGPVGATNLDL